MAAISLHALFAPGMLLRDSDGDGIADGVAAALHVADDLYSCAGAIDLAGRLGLEATGLTLPLVNGQGEFPVRVGPALPLADGLTLSEPGLGLIATTPEGQLAVTGADGPGVCAAARYLAGRYPYLGRAGEGEAMVPEGVTVLLVDGAGVVAYRLAEIWQQVDRTAAESVSVANPVPGSEPESAANPLRSLDQLFVDRDAVIMLLSPELSAPERAALVNLAARFGVEATTLRFPMAVLPGEEAGVGLQVAVTASEGPAEVSITEAGFAVSGVEALIYLANTPDLSTLQVALLPPRTALEEELFTEMTYLGQWEVDRFRRTWQEQVLPTLEPGCPATVDLRLSEPAALRQQIQAELLAQLPPGSSVHVRSCFKQGLHWIMEEVLPELRQAGLVARIELQFRRFTGKAPEGERTLEMPIRWLQECYPADSLLARELNIEAANVTFAMVEEGSTYTLTAYSPAGEAFRVFTYEADTGLRRYLDAFPERGWVHPPTGSLRVNGRDFGPLPTDAEQFWDWYQSSVLPAVRELVVAQHGEKPDPEAQPLFGTLKFAVRMSEEDVRLGIREEQISPLDALHEDLYFVTLDCMATWGRSLYGQPFGAPGTILPFIAAGEGEAPEAHVTLTRRRDASPAAPAALELVRLTLGEEISVGLADGRTVAVPPSASTPVDQAEPVSGITLQDVIGPEQLPAQLAYLKSLPGVRVWQAGTSYLGRPCYAMEFRLPVPEQIMPPAKASAFKPMLLINARHHANEVSSTNAVLKLVERAATGDPEMTAYLRRVNLVINPLENMDGAATHYAMMAEHPTWKLHSARFNAVGLEFYGQYVHPDTPYTEARVLQDLFRQYQPDVLLDDHGVPSHEWLQPFSGYSSAPYFRVSYWLPNALLYGIFRDLDPERYPRQVAATGALRTVLTRRVRENAEQYGWNQEWLEIYQKWGTAWVPEMFPLELHDGMICYTWPASLHVFSVRYPEICVVDWVTEVPDETAQGDHLRLTTEAHVTAHLACLEFLAGHPQPVERQCAQDEVGWTRWTVGRRRPFVTA